MRRFYPPEAKNEEQAIDIAFQHCDDSISGQWPHYSRQEELIIWEQVGWAMSRWGQVEIGLANIFQVASGGSKALPEAIEFWQIHNVSDRIKVVREAVKFWSKTQDNEMQTLAKETLNWVSKITVSLNCARNEIAHGTVIQKERSNDYHLVPFLFKQMIERDREKFFFECKHGRDFDCLVMLRKQFMGFSGLLADMKVIIRDGNGANLGNISEMRILRKNLPLFISQHSDLFHRLKFPPFDQGDSLSKKQITEVKNLIN